MAHGTVKNGVAEGTCTDDDVRICGVLTALAQTRYVTSGDGQIMGVTCKRDRDNRYFTVTVMPHGKPQTSITIVAPDTIKRTDDVYSALRWWMENGAPDTWIVTPELELPAPPPVVVVEDPPVEISPNSSLRRHKTPEELSALDLKPDHPANPPPVLPAKLSPMGRKMQRTVRPRV